MTKHFVAITAAWLVIGLADLPVAVVQAPDSPVRLDHLKVFSADDGPPVLLYAATNLTSDPLDQFTVTVYVFGKDHLLKARQVAPGRRNLDARETKYSAMVLDVGPIEATDSLMAGVDQAQKVGSDDWWRVDLRTLAEQTVTGKKP